MDLQYSCSRARQGSRLYAIKIKLVKRNGSRLFGGEVSVGRTEGCTKVQREASKEDSAWRSELFGSCQFLHLRPKLFYVLNMPSSRLAISHEQELFPTLTCEGHSVAGFWQTKNRDLPLRQDSTVPGVGCAPLKPCRLVVLALKCNDLYPYPVTNSYPVRIFTCTCGRTVVHVYIWSFQRSKQNVTN